jgi:hypothetical protein
MAMAYGDAIRNNANAIQEELACLKTLRQTCTMAI